MKTYSKPQFFIMQVSFMNYYINLITNSIEYIEKNLFESISLELISKEFHLSQYHFDRLFNIIAGTSFKQYVNGRKLTVAAEMLADSKESIIDIALKMGFKYPEVFSRSFKKQFGISPKEFRTSEVEIDKVNKAEVIPRNLVNYNGRLVLKPEYIELEEINLYGVLENIDIYNKGFEIKLYDSAKKFINKSLNNRYLEKTKLYNLINCNGEGSRTYDFYFGKNVLQDSKNDIEQDLDKGIIENSSKENIHKINKSIVHDFEKAIREDFNYNNVYKRTVPKGTYAKFIYKGKMSDIREVFENDLFRWIAAKEIKLNPIGISMISIYDENYYKYNKIQILIPVCNIEI